MGHGLCIVVKCPDCGDVRVAPEEVTVRSCVDDGRWSYRFACPRCQRLAVGESEMSALMDAVDAGAAFEAWSLPVDTSERPGGPLFNLADVFELHLLLLEPEWFEQLLHCDD